MKIKQVTDLFKDPSIKAIGLIADPNSGKSNTIYHIIQAIRENYSPETSIYSYGLRIKVDKVQDIHSVEELEKIHNSVILLDEFPSMFRLSNRRQMENFEESMRKIFHSNNIVVICGLPHSFNKFLSGLLQAVIYKQCTLVDFIQRSPAERIVASYSGGYFVLKGNRMLTMPKDIALIWDGEHFSEVTVPYMEWGDTKRFNEPILKPLAEKIEEPSRLEALLKDIQLP